MRSLLTFCFVTFLFFTNGFCQNGSGWEKLDDQLLSTLNENNQVTALIRLKGLDDLKTPDFIKSKEGKGLYIFNRLKKHAAESQEELLHYMSSLGLEHSSFYIVNVIKTKLLLSDALLLANRADVIEIVSDPVIKLDYQAAEMSSQERMPEPEWGIKMIQADSVWKLGYLGQEVVVAGKDTGYEWEHPALKAKYRGWNGEEADHNYHWHDAIHEISPLHGDTIIADSLNPCGLDVLFPCDDNRHGTHTMGTMVGSNEENAIGVAPKAKWIACRNMERGYGSPSTYIECFEWFLAPTDLMGDNPDPKMSPHVINNSWRCPESEGCNESNWAMMQEVIANLRMAGIVVVASAGNSGSNCETVNAPPAMFGEAFVVGATRANDTIAGFSSRGPVSIDGSFRLKPDVAAPGHQVRSSVLNGGYASFNGTSMAGPHVAGTVALIISANPSLAGDVETIENILKASADPKTSDQDCGEFLGAEVPNAVYGYGRINALKAVEMALSLSNVVEKTTISINQYPNPTSESLHIESEYFLRDIMVFDVLGREQYRGEIGDYRFEISTHDFANGLYFFKVNSFEGEVTGSFVVQH